MKKAILFGSAGLLIGILIGSLVAINDSDHNQPTNHVSVALRQNPPTVSSLLSLVNAERSKNGVAPLKENKYLDKSAQWKADDEVKYNYFGHVKPGTTGNDGLDYLNTLGIECSYVSENLTENTHANTAEAALSAWIASPTHHAAMIDAKYTLTGFGISGNQIVEHFCQTP